MFSCFKDPVVGVFLLRCLRNDDDDVAAACLMNERTLNFDSPLFVLTVWENWKEAKNRLEAADSGMFLWTEFFNRSDRHCRPKLSWCNYAEKVFLPSFFSLSLGLACVTCSGSVLNSFKHNLSHKLILSSLSALERGSQLPVFKYFFFLSPCFFVNSFWTAIWRSVPPRRAGLEKRTKFVDGIGFE